MGTRLFSIHEPLNKPAEPQQLQRAPTYSLLPCRAGCTSMSQERPQQPGAYRILRVFGARPTWCGAGKLAPLLPVRPSPPISPRSRGPNDEGSQGERAEEVGHTRQNSGPNETKPMIMNITNITNNMNNMNIMNLVSPLRHPR